MGSFSSKTSMGSVGAPSTRFSMRTRALAGAAHPDVEDAAFVVGQRRHGVGVLGELLVAGDRLARLLDGGGHLLDDLLGEVGADEDVVGLATLGGVDGAQADLVGRHPLVVPAEVGLDGALLEVRHLPEHVGRGGGVGCEGACSRTTSGSISIFARSSSSMLRRRCRRVRRTGSPGRRVRRCRTRSRPAYPRDADPGAP